MSGLAVEAICNGVGERIIPDWKNVERSASPIAKLRLICDKLDVPFDPSGEPWSTVRWLARFRNEITHAKPEVVRELIEKASHRRGLNCLDDELFSISVFGVMS